MAPLRPHRGPRSAVALALVAVAAVAAEPPAVTVEDGLIHARPASAGATLEVYVDAAGDLPPLLGSLRRERDQLVFEPRYPLSPGMHFRAVFREAAGAEPRIVRLTTPAAPSRPSAFVREIHPSAAVLPENQLKFYLSFSEPMSRGEAYRRISLLDAQGRRVELPFLEIDQELWDPEGKRLTLLFDPGRVKRELQPHDEVGPPLREGESYALVIDAGWPDASGRPLREDARKAFRVGSPDHQPPALDSWLLTAPAAGTREPLTLRFPEPLDRALLESAIAVTLPAGDAVAGSAGVDENETRWRYTPDEPWRPGRYLLRVATILEDLAGNSIGRPFEVDVFERIEDGVLAVSETLPFVVESPVR